MTAEAQSVQEDPFAMIFGEDEIDASRRTAPGQDDVLLVQLRLRRLILSRDFTAFDTLHGPCLPLGPLFEALNFPIEVSETSMNGWYIFPDQIIALDFNSLSARRHGADISIPEGALFEIADGRCLTLPALSTLLEIPMQFDERTLTVQIEPEEILPIEARLEREAYRRLFLESDPDRHSVASQVEVPYRWMSIPTVDLSLSTQAASSGDANLDLEFEAAGDFLRATARLRGAIGQDGASAVRFSLHRRDLYGNIIPGLDLTRIEAGDIAAPGIPLIQQAVIGRGFRLSNAPLFQADVFDQTSIRGPMPIGWEAELYANGELIAFVSETDSIGGYHFENVDLLPGYNRLTVNLFGPYGEAETHRHIRFVGSELTPENEIFYDIGVVQPSDVRENVSGSLPPAPTEIPVFAFATASYGISPTASVGINAVTNIVTGATAFGLNLHGSLLDNYFGLRVVGDDHGEQGIQLSMQRRLSTNTSLSFSHAQLSSLLNTGFESSTSAFSGFGNVRLNSVLNGLGDRFPIQLQSGWETSREGTQALEARARISGSTSGYFWTNVASARLQTGSRGSRETSGQGEFLVSRAIDSGRVRAGISYDFGTELRPKQVEVAYQRRSRLGRSSNFRFGYDFIEERYAVGATTSWEIGSTFVSAFFNTDDRGVWSSGLRLALSLYHDGSRRRVMIGSPGLSRTGAVSAVVFDDFDQNGEFDASDRAMEAVEFIVSNTLRNEATDAFGAALLAGLVPYQPANLEVKSSSLNDAFLQPSQRVVSVVPRPGSIIHLPIPIIVSAEVDGTVFLIRDDQRLPVSGVTVEALDSDGRVLARSQTEFDGYFYVANVPARPVTIRVAPESLSESNLTSQPVQIQLSRQQPTESNLILLIE